MGSLLQVLDEIDDLLAMLRQSLLPYLSSISTGSMRVVPTLRTARVSPASCQKNSPLRGAFARSGLPGTVSTSSPPSMTTRTPRAV
jgi:hypothetical protein